MESSRLCRWRGPRIFRIYRKWVSFNLLKIQRDSKEKHFLAVAAFGISSASFDHVELTEIHGPVLSEATFSNHVKQLNTTVVNLRLIFNPETSEPSHNDSFAFAVPEPFGFYQQNIYNQKATPVFRQNCFMFEAPKPLKPVSRIPKKPTLKRLSKGRSMRI